jgi:CDGSH iron-sulfur domain-containing protein 3
MKKTEIKLLDNGPILLTGEFNVVAMDGKLIQTNTETPVALCRCGSSAKKPYCDGAHKTVGYQSK